MFEQFRSRVIYNRLSKYKRSTYQVISNVSLAIQCLNLYSRKIWHHWRCYQQLLRENNEMNHASRSTKRYDKM